MLILALEPNCQTAFSDKCSECIFPWWLHFLIQFVPIASCAVTGHQREEPDSACFTYSHWAYVHIDQTLLSLCFSRLNNPSSFSLYLYARCSSFLIVFIALHWTHSSKCLSLLHWEARPGPARQVCLTRAEWRGRTTSLLVMLCLIQPRRLLAVFAVTARCWVTFNLLSTRTPKSFPVKLPRKQLVPSRYWCMELFLPSGGTWHFILLNFMRHLSSGFLSLPRSFWTAAQPSGL